MFNRAIHQWLRVPYTLHTTNKKAKGKARATIIFVHGIGNSGAAWNEVITGLPEDVRIVTVDLLGFGNSPRPSWAVYSAKTQARSVIKTLLALRLTGRVIIVGHSLGALVAVEVAKRYPLLVRSLILCSPPFYSNEASKLLRRDDILKRLYTLIHKRPNEFVKISALAMKYKLTNATWSVTDKNVASYMNALEANIVNQTALDDAKEIKKPITILYGMLDPVVLKANLKELTKANPQAKLVTMKTAGHEVRGRYVHKVVDIVLAEINGRKNHY